ncbi:MAG: hypothetical protein IPK52_11610 [Chloroflexi bacterium]|nr:hypothetical protein [Chloroflexota bacterium]
MVSIAVGSYLVKTDIWDSESELTVALDKCTLGSIRLQNDEYPSDDVYSLRVQSDKGTFGIGIITYHNGILPSMICINKSLCLVIGFGANVYTVDIAARKLVTSLSLDYEFYQFHTLEHLGIHDFFLVQSEMEVIACSTLGKRIWGYSGNDIISSLVVSQSEVELHLIDGSQHNIGIVDGIKR